MKRFTESIESKTELNGWALWIDNGMHKVEFQIENNEFNARADGEIWDYSDDPNEFSKFIKDGNVYTNMEIKENRIEYTNPVSLTNWIKSNTRNVFNIVEELSDIEDYFQEFFDESNEVWKIEIKTEKHQYKYENGTMRKINLDSSNGTYNPRNNHLSIIIFTKKIFKYDASHTLNTKDGNDNLIKIISGRISNSKNFSEPTIRKYTNKLGIVKTKGYEITYEIPK